MRFSRVVTVAIALGGLAAAVSGPNDRQITDPKSIISATNPNAKPVAVEDLYVTRLIDTAALSPNGAEVALTTNLTGRTNLWKISAEGSWPVQSLNSDDRQLSRRRLPIAVGSPTSRQRRQRAMEHVRHRARADRLRT